MKRIFSSISLSHYGSPAKRARTQLESDRDSQPQDGETVIGHDLLRVVISYLDLKSIAETSTAGFLPAIEFMEYLDNTQVRHICESYGLMDTSNPDDSCDWKTSFPAQIATTDSGTTYVELLVNLFGPVRGFYGFLRHIFEDPKAKAEIMNSSILDNIKSFWPFMASNCSVHLLYLACVFGLTNAADDIFDQQAGESFAQEFYAYQRKPLLLSDKDFLANAIERQHCFLQHGQYYLRDVMSVVLLSGNVVLFCRILAHGGFDSGQAEISCSNAIFHLAKLAMQSNMTVRNFLKCVELFPCEISISDICWAFIHLTHPGLLIQHEEWYRFTGSVFAYNQMKEFFKPDFWSQRLKKCEAFLLNKTFFDLIAPSSIVWTVSVARREYSEHFGVGSSFRNIVGPNIYEEHERLFGLILAEIEKQGGA